MRIAYITSAYGRASDTFIRNEVKELWKLGHTVDTFSIRKPEAAHIVDEDVSAERAQTTYILDSGLVRLIAATVLEGLTHPLRFFRALRLVHQLTGDGIKNRIRQIAYLMESAFLARALRSRRIQHIHDHIGENSAVVAATAALLVGIPFSMTLHGPSVFYAPEQFRLARKISRSAFCVCISQFARSQCMGFTDPAQWSKLQIVRCAIGPEFAKHIPAPVPETLKLISVARLSPEKGQAVLVEAVALLKRRGVSVNIDIVGDGPIRSQLQAQIDGLGLSDSIRLVGWKNPQEIVELLKASRGLVLPSFAEGLPVVLMESLAIGRPAITTWIAGVPELVENGVNGWLVPAGSVEALAEAMERAVTAPTEKLTHMGAWGREKVLRMHDAATEAGKLAKLFEEAVAGR